MRKNKVGYNPPPEKKRRPRKPTPTPPPKSMIRLSGTPLRKDSPKFVPQCNGEEHVFKVTGNSLQEGTKCLCGKAEYHKHPQVPEYIILSEGPDTRNMDYEVIDKLNEIISYLKSTAR